MASLGEDAARTLLGWRLDHCSQLTLRQLIAQCQLRLLGLGSDDGGAYREPPGFLFQQQVEHTGNAKGRVAAEWLEHLV